MPWMRLDPAALIPHLRFECDPASPDDDALARKATAHLRKALLTGKFYGVALSSHFDETASAFVHKSLTHGLDQTNCRRAASPQLHAGLR